MWSTVKVPITHDFEKIVHYQAKKIKIQQKITLATTPFNRNHLQRECSLLALDRLISKLAEQQPSLPATFRCFQAAYYYHTVFWISTKLLQNAQ